MVVRPPGQRTCLYGTTALDAVLDRMARQGTPGRFRFPRPLRKDPRLTFSFSGLKTAVRTRVADLPRPLAEQDVADVCHGLREAVVDHLLERPAK